MTQLINSNTNSEHNEFVQVDAQKTKLLRSIIAKFKNSLEEDYEMYRRQYRIRAMRNREFLLQEIDKTTEEFGGYLREMENDREKWYSEQYIYDALGM